MGKIQITIKKLGIRHSPYESCGWLRNRKDFTLGIGKNFLSLDEFLNFIKIYEYVRKYRKSDYSDFEIIGECKCSFLSLDEICIWMEMAEVFNTTSSSLLGTIFESGTNNWRSSFIPLIFICSDFFLDTCSNSNTIKGFESRLHSILLNYGVPSASLPTAEEIVLSMCATILTLLAYFFLFGKRHVKRRKILAEELKLSQQKVGFVHRFNLKKCRQHGKKNLSYSFHLYML